MTGAEVVTVTANPAIDHTVWVPGFAAGEVNRVAHETATAGGKGVNVAADLAALGVSTVVTGFLGRDNVAVFESRFAAASIADRFVRVDGSTRTNMKIVDDGRPGFTTDVNFPGIGPSPTDVDDLTELVAELSADARWVVLAGSLPPDAPGDLYARLVDAAHDSDALVAVDTSGPALAAAVAATPDLIKPNRSELESLLDRALPDDAALLGAIDDLRGRGIANVVVSLGGDGAIFATEKGTVRAPAAPIAVVSTVGAGDAMVAGTIAGLLREEPLDAVAAIATACSAQVLSSVGTEVDPAAVQITAESLDIEVLGTRAGTAEEGEAR